MSFITSTSRIYHNSIQKYSKFQILELAAKQEEKRKKTEEKGQKAEEKRKANELERQVIKYYQKLSY